MANIVILTHWTGGDVYPFIRIGRRLRRRGHTVTLITHAIYGDAVRQAGLVFDTFDTLEDWAIFLKEDMPRLTELMDNLHNISQAIQERPKEEVHAFTYEQIHCEYAKVKQYCSAPDTILVTRHGSSGAALLVAEELDLPVVSVYLAPAMVIQPLIDDAMMGELLVSDINSIRARLDFAPIRSWSAWVNAAHYNIGLWPDWFAAPEANWPVTITAVGFPLEQEEAATLTELPPPIQEMLRRGERPVLISGGTGKIVRSGFYAVCVEACRLLGYPAVVACQHREMVPDELPDHIKWFHYLQFPKVMPFMGSIIHHGGIGTVGQAMLAGLPQLILAHGMDRPDNALRLKQFGGADMLMFMKWKPEFVAEALQSLAAPEVRERCGMLAQRVRENDTLGRAADVIESAIHDRAAHLSSADFLARPATAIHAGSDRAQAEQVVAYEQATPANHTARPNADKLSNLSPEQVALLVRRLQQKKGRV